MRDGVSVELGQQWAKRASLGRPVIGVVSNAVNPYIFCVVVRAIAPRLVPLAKPRLSALFCFFSD